MEDTRGEKGWAPRNYFDAASSISSDHGSLAYAPTKESDNSSEDDDDDDDDDGKEYLVGEHTVLLLYSMH